MGSIGWSELPHDIVFLIVGQKQLSLIDVARMAAVCKSWRSILRENDWFGLHMNPVIGKTPFPWLMLSEPTSYLDTGKRGFFCPITGQVSELYLPEAEGRRCCGSSYGWIVTMGEDMEINLLNPLSKVQVSLPSQFTFGEFTDGSTNRELHASYTNKELVSTFIRKAILTGSPSTSECAVVAFLFPLVDYQLAYAKLGDPAWTLIPPLSLGQEADDFLFCQGHLFGISLIGELMVLDLDHDPKHEWKVISKRLYKTCRLIFPDSFCHFYLAEIGSEFVAVARARQSHHGVNAHRTTGVALFKFKKGEWYQIKDIGDCCLFLGVNQTICLSPVPRGYCPNCIYFTDDYPFYRSCKRSIPIRGGDMVVYSLVNGKFRQFYNGVSLSEFSPPLWLTLNF